MTFPSFRLDGQVAIVTGGGGGLGSLAARAFAAAGADVVVAARSLDRCQAIADAVEATGRRALALSCDVTDEASAGALAARVLDSFGRIDILFNNAGITSPKSVADLGGAEFRRVLDVSVTGTYLVTRAVVPSMIERRFGRIINMGSILSGHGMANRSAYCAAKAGVANLTRAFAVEFGGQGITVNAVAPTVIVTDLNRELMQLQPQLYEKLLARTPLGRLGQPEDLAGALVFLASPAAGFITGQILSVDGGFDAT